MAACLEQAASLRVVGRPTRRSPGGKFLAYAESDEGVECKRSIYLVVRQSILRLLVAAVAVVSSALAQTAPAVPPSAPTIETIITRMAQARVDSRAQLRAYKVTRDYKLFGKDMQKSKFEAVAALTFIPPDSKKYAIQRSSGPGLGERIVRQMLDNETGIVKNYGSTDISPANYDLRFIGQEQVNGARCYVLDLIPRRKEPHLLRGKIWVDANTYLLHRMEGVPPKAPSWWLRDARITFTYSAVGGMWLQTGSESTANVRLIGQHTLVSRDVGYEISEPGAVAALTPVP
jgi:hypothetical protein